MDLKVVSGKTIELPAEFFSGTEPTDPASPRVDIVDPSGAVVVTNGVPVRERKGIYRFNYAVPASAPTGTWEAIWNATIDGSRVSASDLFEVRPAPAKAPLPAAPPEPASAAKRSETPKTAENAPSKGAVPPAAKPSEKSGTAAAKTAETSKAPADTRKDTGSPKKVTQAASRSKGKAPSAKSEPGTSKRDAKQAARKGRGRLGRKREVAAAPAASTGARSNTGAEPSRKRRGLDDPDQAQPRTRLSGGKALLIVGALAIVLAAIWFSPRRQDSVQATIDQGVAAQKAGRTAEAQRLYEDVLQNDPGNKLANFNLGVAAQVAGDIPGAEDLYQKSLQTDPYFLPALFNLAILQEREGRNEDSEETYRRLLERYPDNGPAHLNYGFLLAQKLNRPDEGRAEFSRAVEIDPGLAARIPPELRPAPAPAQ